jgi:hypothetical protein
MRQSIRYTALLIIAAFITALTGVVVAAPPAAACALGCGDPYIGISVLQFDSTGPTSTLIYGHSTRFGVVVGDDSTVGYDCPTGEVRVYADADTTPFGTDTLDPNDDCDPYAASYATVFYAGLSAGPHTIRVDYIPGNFDSESETLDIGINPADTAVSLFQSTGTSQHGDPVTLTAAVRDTGGIELAEGAHLPSGNVEFYDNGALVGAAPIAADRTATLSPAVRGAGSHSFIAKYAGDGDYNFSLSPTVMHTVLQASTATSLDQSAATTVYGQGFQLFGTVRPPAVGIGNPTGLVRILDGGVLEANVQVGNAGPGAFQVTSAVLPPGTHTLTATYDGDPDFETSTSQPITHVVNKADTTVVLSSPTVDPSPLGGPVTLRSHVAVTSPGFAFPSGTVQFRDGAAALGSPVSVTPQGDAELTVTTLGGGTHSITAAYSGDDRLNPSTSSPLTRTVTCTTIVTGTVGGSYAVPASGTTCFSSAHIGGNINIPAGARVSFAGTSVGGSITGSGAYVLMCATTVGGAVTLQGAGPITMGDSVMGCAPNVVSGTLQISSAKSGVRIFDNDVRGNLIVTGTSGGATIIGGNTVGGTLSCSGNNPAATNGGRPNRAPRRSGECAASGF